MEIGMIDCDGFFDTFFFSSCLWIPPFCSCDLIFAMYVCVLLSTTLHVLSQRKEK